MVSLNKTLQRDQQQHILGVAPYVQAQLLLIPDMCHGERRRRRPELPQSKRRPRVVAAVGMGAEEGDRAVEASIAEEHGFLNRLRFPSLGASLWQQTVASNTFDSNIRN